MLRKIQSQTIVATSTILMWIALGTVMVHRLESWNWIQSFYFSVITLTTVGYGDLVPTTDATRLFVSIYVLIGVGAVVAALGIIGTSVLNEREQKLLKSRAKKNKK